MKGLRQKFRSLEDLRDTSELDLVGLMDSLQVQEQRRTRNKELTCGCRLVGADLVKNSKENSFLVWLLQEAWS